MAPMAPMAPAALALVALTALRAPAWACLSCFTTYEERLRICQSFSNRSPEVLDTCFQTLENTFKVIEDVEINYDEQSRLHSNFTQIVFNLEEAARNGDFLLPGKQSYWGYFPTAFIRALRKAEDAIAELKPAQNCVPPCGLQEKARRFRCRVCASDVCGYPLDCPVQDVTALRGEQAMFSCSLGFPLPRQAVTYSWKFAAGLRTEDPTLFRDLPRAAGHVARVRPVQPEHRGTFCCVIRHDEVQLARLYFFLNVTGPPPRAETELQVIFREVLAWGPRDAEMVEPWKPSFGELLGRRDALTPENRWLLAAVAALASAGATLLVWMFIRWYCSSSSSSSER